MSAMSDPFAAYLQITSERERAMIARELHDEVGGILAASKLELDIIGRQLPADAGEVRDKLRRLIGALDAGLAVERRLVERLRPSVLDHLGLYAAIRWQVNEQCRRAGIPCEVLIRASGPEHVAESAIVVLRMLEDAVAFALAQGATGIEVDVQNIDKSLEVLVRSDGAALPEESQSTEARERRWAAGERAGMLGGICIVAPIADRGSSTLLRVPLANLERARMWPWENATPL
jgi:signal transduction histidine kinase